MLSELAVHFPRCACFDRMDRAARLRGDPWCQLGRVSGAGWRGRRPQCGKWRGVRAVFAADQALAGLLGDLGVVPQAIVGHSSGEYAALLAAGAVRLAAEADLIDKMHAMSRLGEQATSRGLVADAPLLAVSPTSPEQIPALLARGIGSTWRWTAARQVVLGAREASRGARSCARRG
jgi:hypothetical protein